MEQSSDIINAGFQDEYKMLDKIEGSTF